MRYDPMNEKAPVAPSQSPRPAGTQNYKQNNDIRRARLVLLILLGIQLVLSLIYFIQRIVALIQYYRLSDSARDAKLSSSYIGNVVAGGISLLYLIVFLIVVIKYARIGILIFAWLGLLELILVLIVVILAIIAVVTIAAAAHSAGVGIVGSVIVIVVAGIAFLLTILTVIFAFKLAKLIKMQEAYQYV